METSLSYLDSIQLMAPGIASNQERNLRNYYTTRLTMEQKLKAQMGLNIQQESFIAQQKENDRKQKVQARKEIALLAVIVILLIVSIVLSYFQWRKKVFNRLWERYISEQYNIH